MALVCSHRRDQGYLDIGPLKMGGIIYAVKQMAPSGLKESHYIISSDFCRSRWRRPGNFLNGIDVSYDENGQRENGIFRVV